jgi:putative glutamine amidotransferase
MPRTPREPRIGITCEAVPRRKDYSNYDLKCNQLYPRAVREAGGLPVLLPIAYRKSMAIAYLDGVDGLVIVGGDDVDPALYGETPKRATRVGYRARMTYEGWLYREARRRRLPVLAICYGMQLVNVVEGGTLLQDIQPKRHGPRVAHNQREWAQHPVQVLRGTHLRKILGIWRAQVTTGHHQAVRELAPGFVVAAVAQDGIIEAIERPDYPELLAVQWHPEQSPRSRVTRKLFGAFVRACRRPRTPRKP